MMFFLFAIIAAAMVFFARQLVLFLDAEQQAFYDGIKESRRLAEEGRRRAREWRESQR